MEVPAKSEKKKRNGLVAVSKTLAGVGHLNVNSARVALVTTMCHLYSFWLRPRGLSQLVYMPAAPLKD